MGICFGVKMKNLLARFTYKQLTLFGVFMLFMPLVPEPHLVQKLSMFLDGSLSQGKDIFDVFWHTLPFWIMGLKRYLEKQENEKL